MEKNSKFTTLTQTASNSGVSPASTCDSILVLETNSSKKKPLSLDGQITRAEILWSLNVAQKGYAYSSLEEKAVKSIIWAGTMRKRNPIFLWKILYFKTTSFYMNSYILENW